MWGPRQPEVLGEQGDLNRLFLANYAGGCNGLPQGKDQVKFLLVTIDCFTKWVEAEALAMIIEARIRSFVWKNIICRFRIPLTIISDNG